MLQKAMLAVGALLMGVGLTPAYAASTPDVRLIQAVKDGDNAAIRSLLKQHIDVNAAEPDGTTALHWAAQHGNREAVDALVRAKAAVNARNRYGMAPIWVAAANWYG